MSVFRVSLPLCGALALSVASFPAQAGVLSGAVLDLDSVGKAGVTVELRSQGVVLATASTAANGNWSIDATSGVSLREARRMQSGNLALDSRGRLRVSFGGRDLSGRSFAASATAPSNHEAFVPRVAGSIPDTLVYSLAGRVFLRDTVSDSVRSGMVRVFDTSWNADIVYGYLKDTRDGKVYRTVKVGTQTWFAQNLAFKRDTSWRNRDSLEMELLYGRMYQWTAAMDTSGTFNTDAVEIELPWRGICPTDWHVPSDPEWSTLINFADSANSGAALKSLGFPNKDTTIKALDTWGFRVLAGGQVGVNAYYPYGYVYRAFGSNGMFWTATEFSATKAYVRNFMASANYSNRALWPKNEGYSVRCLKN